MEDVQKFPDIMSTPEELKKFIEGYIYHDFKNELLIRIEQIQSILDDDELQHSGREYDRARGGKKMAKECIDIFTCLMENRINDIEMEGREGNDDT